MDRRTEKKFIVSPENIGPLERYLRTWFRPDRVAEWYTVGSTYYDTRDFTLYRATKDRNADRLKIRMRSYLDHRKLQTGEPFLELKARVDGLTVKERVDVDHFADRLSGKFFPIVDIEYERNAYESEGIRVTIDHNVRAQLLSPIDGTMIAMTLSPYRSIFPEATIIAEVKYTNPLKLTPALAKYLGEPVRLSKYTAAVEAFYGEIRVAKNVTEGAGGPFEGRALRSQLLDRTAIDDGADDGTGSA